MSIKDWATLAICALLTVVIVYVMFQNSRKNREEFESEAHGDEAYERRMFVLKMYDSLNKKPTPEELDRVASLGDKVKIMEYIVSSEKNHKNSVDVVQTNFLGVQRQELFSEDNTRVTRKTRDDLFDEEDDVFGAIDVDDVYSEFLTPPSAPASSNTSEPAAFVALAPAAAEQTTTHHGNDEPSSPVPIPAPPPSSQRESAKKYVRDMYVLLGKLDDAILA